MRFEAFRLFSYSMKKNHTMLMSIRRQPFPEDSKTTKSSEIMEIQSQISWWIKPRKNWADLAFVIIDRKEGNHFYRKKEFDSPWCG